MCKVIMLTNSVLITHGTHLIFVATKYGGVLAPGNINITITEYTRYLAVDARTIIVVVGGIAYLVMPLDKSKTTNHEVARIKERLRNECIM